MFEAKDGQVDDCTETMGKSLLHLAVEYGSTKIVEFLLFETQADPNEMTHNTHMAAIHLAIVRSQPGLIELLLMSEKADLNLVSDLHGTPLHTACKSGQLKIVQQLLLNNADTEAKNSGGMVPRDVAADARIVALIDRYEQRR